MNGAGVCWVRLGSTEGLTRPEGQESSSGTHSTHLPSEERLLYKPSCGLEMAGLLVLGLERTGERRAEGAARPNPPPHTHTKTHNKPPKNQPMRYRLFKPFLHVLYELHNKP